MAYTKRSDAELLQAALVGYQHQHAMLGERIAEITRELGGGRAGERVVAGGANRKRVVSAATRRRMAEAQQKRWAGAAKSGTAAGKKRKRNMSAEGRERIAEATRKRWEAFRAAKAAVEK